MENIFKVEIISREIIKPSSPTCKIQQNLSLIDQMAPKVYIPLILFYFSDIKEHLVHRQVLKTSLSKVLTHFYPFAGRIKDTQSIECNDYGVEYVEARVNLKLSDMLRDSHTENLALLVPVEVDGQEATSNGILQVQVSFFESGGMAIGVCLSHKIADASTLGTFLNAWSNEASGYGEVIIPDLYAGSSLFPPTMNSSTPCMVIPRRGDLVRTRYVFNSSSIEELRNIASSTTVPKPARVEVVTALIWKCFTKGCSPPYICFHALNMRKRLTPPLERHVIGNIIGMAAAQVDVKEIELKDLVCQLRKTIQQHNKVDGNRAIENFCRFAQMIGGEEKVDSIILAFSGWCKQPFYESDFGWGKPAWVAYLSVLTPSSIVLMDANQGDGIEVWACLSKGDGDLLQLDQEFLSFASVNPSPLSP